MASYLLKRLLGTLPTLLGVSVLVFFSLHLTPGDPAQVILGPKATATSLAALRTELGLDQPIYVQYARWIGGVVTGDWGRSIQLKAGVLPLVWERLQATLILAVAAMLIAVVTGLALGVLSAVRAGSLVDRSAIATSLVGYSLPPFFLGIVLQVLFGLRAGWFPVTGMYRPGSSEFGDLLLHLVLPAVTLGASMAALLMRLVRSPGEIVDGSVRLQPRVGEAVDLLARTEGIVVDPVYSAKAVAAIIDRSKRQELAEPVVFWHTGGMHAMFDPHYAQRAWSEIPRLAAIEL